MARELVEVDRGTLKLNFHSGQLAAWESARRFVVMLAGTQGGKTSFGPHWLLREMQRCGAGDYLVVAPTFPLLELKAIPVFRYLFETLMQLGKYTATPTRKFIVSDSGARRLWGKVPPGMASRVLFGYAADPESLEASTARAAWLDEAGQNKFRFGAWEAIRRRLSLARGRVLIGTTVYNLGWLKSELYDRRGGDVEIVQFDSTENPNFSAEEFDERKRTMPRWKFDMFYRGRFARPAGLIYDNFDDKRHLEKRFAVPSDWRRVCGIDFGGVNTAAVFLAQSPQGGAWHLYKTYRGGNATSAAHVAALLRDDVPPRAYGGAKSEEQWRAEFRAAGLSVALPPVSDVEVGINRVYGGLATDGLIVFDDLADLLDELRTYARVTNDVGEVQAGIADKSDFHLLDALRYVGSAIFGGVGAGHAGVDFVSLD